jgi:PadR family transcriptional regulator, regulatory protein PadR
MTRSSDEEALEQWETQLRKGLLGLAVLAALSRSRLYGVELLKRLEGSALVVSEGTIYPLLSRLRAEELVTAEWVESTAGPPRKYYALTALGRSRVRAMAQAWERCSTALDGLLNPTTEDTHD